MLNKFQDICTQMLTKKKKKKKKEPKTRKSGVSIIMLSLVWALQNEGWGNSLPN